MLEFTHAEFNAYSESELFDLYDEAGIDRNHWIVTWTPTHFIIRGY